MRRGKARPKTSQVNKPVQIQSNVRLSHRYRFTLSAALSNIGITVNNLLCAAGTVGFSTTQVVSLYGAVKVSHVEIFSPIPSQGSFATCSCEWIGSLGSMSTNEVSDTSVSTSTPAHIMTRPPRNSLASFWQSSNLATSTLFVLNAPTGSIIDISMNLILYDEETQDSAGSAVVATAVAGIQYYLALDGPSTNLAVPVSLHTTH